MPFTEIHSSASAPAPAAEANAAEDRRRLALRLVVTYLLMTFALSAVWETLIIRAGTLRAAHGLYVLGVMWSPGLSALAARLIWQRNVRGQGWGWGATRWQVLAYLIPLTYAAVAYGAVWLLGLGRVSAYPGSILVLVGVGTLSSCTSALGEELGWRGLLVPELARLTSFTKLSLLSGAIWAAWHVPVILFADYNSGTPGWYAVLCFAVMVIGISFLFAWMRLKSGSVWTGMFLHASHNLWIQGYFDRVTVNTGPTPWLIGEFGAALAITSIVVALIFWRLRDRLPMPNAAPVREVAPAA